MCEIIIHCKESFKLSAHVNMLIEALSKVDKIYWGDGSIFAKQDKKEDATKYAERVFAYELYHQFRSLMTDDCGYYLNGEIKKDNEIFEWEMNRNCYPDLVLHGNLYNIEDGSQYFLCEIKMAHNPYLLDDLDKLARLSDSNLGFQDYISLCIGISKTELKEKIDNQRRDNRKFNNETLCICRKDNVIDVFKLSDIIS